MKLTLNWSKIFLDFYPEDMVKQFKKVSIPFYLSFSLLFFYILQDFEALFISKVINLGTVFAFYFLLPILFPSLLIGLILSSVHILRHNNPIILYHINFKHFLLYVLNFGMIIFSSIFLTIYSFFINQVFKII